MVLVPANRRRLLSWLESRLTRTFQLPGQKRGIPRPPVPCTPPDPHGDGDTGPGLSPASQDIVWVQAGISHEGSGHRQGQNGQSVKVWRRWVGEVSGAAREGRHHHPSSSRCIQVAIVKEQLEITRRLYWEKPILGENWGGMWLHGSNKRGSLRAMGYERDLW